MISPAKHTGFSLLEVVLAAGIFAVAVTVMLALLPALTRQSTESAGTLVAQGLPDSLRAELRRLAANDFNGLAHTIPIMGTPLEDGLMFAASRDGSRLHSTSYLPPATSGLIPLEQRYFAIEAWRFSQGALEFTSTASVLVVYVRVSWPAYNPGSTAVTPLADRSQFTFTLAFDR